MNELNNTWSDYKDFLEKRKSGFLGRLRSGGVDLSSAQFLRESVRTIGEGVLALDSEGTSTDSDDEENLTITRTITTPAVDRYGDIVIPRGCMGSLPKYRKNPQVFFAHKSNELPIATAIDIQVSDTNIISTAKFHEETEEARVIWRLRKLLKSTSIGFLPVKASVIGSNKSEEEKEDEYRKNRKEKTPEGEKIVKFDSWFALRFLEWELIEWSVVPIPANPECCDSLQKFLSDGVVEGEKIPLSISKSLEPFKHKARVWVHGFEPEKTKHSGMVTCGEHELEFKDGKIVKCDSVSISSDLDQPIPVPNPADDNPPGMRGPGDPLLNRLSMRKKDVKCGEQDPMNPQILALPNMTQPNHFSCGLYATWGVAKFFGVGPDTYEEWDKLLHTSAEESTKPKTIIEVLSGFGLTVEARDNMTIEDLHQCWLDGHPCITPVADYGPDVPPEAKWEFGHYLVVIGCCMGKVFCSDSSENNVTRGSDSIQEGGRIMVDAEKWMSSWHDEDVDGNKLIQYGIICCSGDKDISPPVELMEEAKKFLSKKE